MPDGIFGIILTCVIVVIVFSLLLFLLKRYKKCPSDKVMVIYGKVGSNKDGSTKSAECIHGGAAFIWPVIQAYEFLDLTPLSISVDLENALSRQNIRINVPSRFTVGISTEPGVMQNAAERLLGLRLQEIQELAKDIIFGQLRLVIATMDIEEINTDRDKFLEAVSRNVEGELKKIGLRLINVNVTDISDESGYIDALGKEAAAKAINIVHSDSYKTTFSYNRWDHLYKMSMYSRADGAFENTVDELTGKQLGFTNLLVCFAGIADYPGDSGGVQQVDYVSGGEAYFFTRGAVQHGTWQKASPEHPLKVYAADGSEICFNRGKTYLAIVDDDEWQNFNYQ